MFWKKEANNIFLARLETRNSTTTILLVGSGRPSKAVSKVCWAPVNPFSAARVEGPKGLSPSDGKSLTRALSTGPKLPSAHFAFVQGLFAVWMLLIHSQPWGNEARFNHVSFDA